MAEDPRENSGILLFPAGDAEYLLRVMNDFRHERVAGFESQASDQIQNRTKTLIVQWVGRADRTLTHRRGSITPCSGKDYRAVACPCTPGDIVERG